MPMDDFAAFERVAQKIAPEGRLLRAWPLTGGVSTRVTALEIAQAGGETLRTVVRQHGEADLSANPRVAADEYRLLRALAAAEIPVPAPYLADESGEIFPTPYLVAAFVDGETDFVPPDAFAVAQEMAALLARIHSVGTGAAAFLPPITARIERLLRQPPVDRADPLESEIRAALGAAWPLPARNPAVLLHGDYWPGNILWQGERLAAVIDWEDAALGDPLADVAICRLDMLWAFGVEVMAAFSEAYCAAASPVDCADLPCWDLYAALRPIGQFVAWAPNAQAAERMIERHRFFAKQAFEHLSETSLRPPGRS